MQPDLELALLRDHGALDKLTDLCISQVGSAAHTHPAWVSVDVDYVQVTSAGARQ